MSKYVYGPNNKFYLGYLEVKSIFRSANRTPHVVSSLFSPAAIHTFSQDW